MSDVVIRAMREWVAQAVVGLNLCPFAKAPWVKGQIRFVVNETDDPRVLLDALCVELAALNEADAAQVETTLLIHPNVLGDFLDFNDFLDAADAALADLGLEGVLQIASFHPDYQFAGNDVDDLSNATNRAPYPTLHLLREASVARAVGQTSHHHDTSHQQPQLYDFVERVPGKAPDYKDTCLEHEADPLPAMRASAAKVWSDLSVWENYYAEEFAYLVAQLSSHGVLDRTAIVWGSEIDTGSGHSHYNMPFVVAAGSQIPLERGKVVRFPVSYDQNNQMGCIASAGVSPSHNDLMRTVLQALGVTLPSVGSASAEDPSTKVATQLNQRILTELLA
jgi:hypothetical protein